MKVYELAKKLEVKSVFLMDKIRKEWKLPVKTHMETLTPELAKKIEQKFYDSQKSTVKKVSKKKKTTVKKIPAKKTTIKKATIEKKIRKKTGTTKTDAVKKQVSSTKRTIVKKQKSSISIEKDSPLIEEAIETRTASPQPKRKIIIRRKTEEQKPS